MSRTADEGAVFKLWDAIVDFFKEGPWWDALRPAFAFVYVYLAALVFLYEYVQWAYGLAPALGLFLQSYLVKQTSAIFAALAILFLLVRVPRAATAGWLGRFRGSIATVSVWRLAVGCAVIITTAVLVMRSAPVSVRHMRVKFFDEPGDALNRYAFVYLLFELNKLQRSWYFDVDFDDFNETALTSTQRADCGGRPLCLAQTLAGDVPIIMITSQRLGEDSFSQNEGGVSVISTFDWERYAPPSVYEFLIYSVLVQSVLIHLKTQCSLPLDTMSASRVSRGDLFQFIPRRQGMKAEILAAHLSPQGQELLMNCFGVEYLSTTASLLTLDWLDTAKVKENLQRAFGVDLTAPPNPRPVVPSTEP